MYVGGLSLKWDAMGEGWEGMWPFANAWEWAEIIG